MECPILINCVGYFKYSTWNIGVVCGFEGGAMLGR
jgi:hypothetical protein